MNRRCPHLPGFQRSAAGAALIVFALLRPGEIMAAGPSVTELLSVCERAFARGNTGLDAAVCEWYAAPCACSVRAPDDGILSWCIPAPEAIDSTVSKVVAELRHYPDPGADVNLVVPEILTRIYPCGTAKLGP